ncbi:MAG TPA: class I SAM-dependent methyltransferase [Acidimicrobiaceae bacterium]|nr:class I SAM-dependent methyltransferase [Acidimicrobiaceae bacterium]
MSDVGGHDAVRRSYDQVAQEYFARLRDELDYKPLDRALLGLIVEEVGSQGSIADVGCGPGHVAGWLADRSASVVGIDLSPGMVSLGRQSYPRVEFRQGDMLSLPAEDDEFAAVIALYSIIHLTEDELQPAFEEIARVLQPQGLLLVSFHMGLEVRHLSDWWGHPVDIDFRFLEPDSVIPQLEQAGLVVETRLERQNYPDEVETRRAYVLARRRPAPRPDSAPVRPAAAPSP